MLVGMEWAQKPLLYCLYGPLFMCVCVLMVSMEKIGMITILSFTPQQPGKALCELFIVDLSASTGPIYPIGFVL